MMWVDTDRRIGIRQLAMLGQVLSRVRSKVETTIAVRNLSLDSIVGQCRFMLSVWVR